MKFPEIKCYGGLAKEKQSQLETLLVYTNEWAFCHIPKNAGSNFKIQWRLQYNISQKNDTEKLRHQPPSWFEYQWPTLQLSLIHI